jgi:dinuclear metal center YbgI/SA1388 family protein
VAAPVLLRDVVAALDARYDPAWAEPWDAVGLVTGDPDAEVRRVLLAVDPVDEVVQEAADWGADLLVTHHPLLLRPVSSVATSHPKGRTVTALVRQGIALHVAHTNADVAAPGVSDALAGVLGLQDLRPLRPRPDAPARGTGRVGVLAAPEPLGEFADRVAAALPATPGGVRVAGDPDAPVRTVAVCGGAGDDLFDEVRSAAADVYVTADLRHHPASESLAHGGPALVDCSHWASEWPWLPEAAAGLGEDLGDRATTVEVRVSRLVTDPWHSTSGTGAPS